MIADGNATYHGDSATARTGAKRSALVAPALLRDLVRGADLVVVGVLGLAIYLIRVHPDEPYRISAYIAAVALSVLLMGVIGQSLGLYRSDVVFVRWLRLGRALATWALVFAGLIVVAFALKISDSYSRIWAFSWFLFTTSALGLIRLALSAWIERQVAAGLFANRTVILGTGPQAEKLAAHLAHGDPLQTRMLGLIDDGSTAPAHQLREPVLGSFDTLSAMIHDGLVDQVVVALPWQDSEHIRRAAYRLALYPVTVFLAPGLASLDFPGRTYTQISGVPMLQLYSRPFSGWARVVKGIEDRVLAAGFLVALAPLMLLIAAAIRIESQGPALFRQQRYGFNNNLIEVYKFRTMYQNVTDAAAERLTTRGDPRVTRIGRFLRRSSLDELPQFFNVLRGEMSVVGPRPHAVAAKAAGQLYDEAVDRYAARHKVKPGITGWAQVNGWRGETDTLEKLQRRVDCDLYYIDNWSLWLDVQIIARSIFIVFGDKAAY